MKPASAGFALLNLKIYSNSPSSSAGPGLPDELTLTGVAIGFGAIVGVAIGVDTGADITGDGLGVVEGAGGVLFFLAPLYALAPKKTDTRALIATKYVGAISPIILAAFSNPNNDVIIIVSGYNSMPNKANHVILRIASR